jgi:toxin CptA
MADSRRPPVRAEVRPSRLIAATLTVIHVLAGLAVLPLHVPVIVKLALIIATCVSFAHGIWRHALLGSRSAVIALEMRDRETVKALTRDGRWHEGRVLGTTYLSGRLALLNLRLRNKRLARHVVLVPDNIDPEEFRQLRVMLRWGGAKAN